MNWDDYNRSTTLASGDTLLTRPVTPPTNAPEDVLQRITKDDLATTIEPLFTWKPSARLVTVSNVDLTTELRAGDTEDGKTLVVGDVVLLTAQTTMSENGPYTVQASGAPVRTVTTGSLLIGAAYHVRDGNAYAGSLWACVTPGPITLGTTPLSFRLASGAVAPTLATIVTNAVASPLVLVAANSGGLYSNVGAAAEKGVTLPLAADGLSYTFLIESAFGLTIFANDADVIKMGGQISGPGGTARSFVVGSSVRLSATAAAGWWCSDINGSWQIS